MSNSAIDQYRKVLDGLPRAPISHSGEKFERYEKLAKILYQIFTPEIWKEWDDTFPHLEEWKNSNTGVGLPSWMHDDSGLMYRVSTSRFKMECLEKFGSFYIEKYISMNHSELGDITEHDRRTMIGGWLTACHNCSHVFLDFSSLKKGEDLTKSPEERLIKKTMVASSVLELGIFNNYSPRHFYLVARDTLERVEELKNYPTHGERVGCIATRKFPGITPKNTLFDELFSRICQIYGYNDTNSLRQSTGEKVVSLCPFKHQ